MAEKDKKNIFDKVSDLFSGKEEKEEDEQKKTYDERKKAYEERKKAEEFRASKQKEIKESLEVKKTKIIATHTVESGETLSHIALEYYNHATPPYWKYLLEHNKEALEGNERNLQPGMEIEIPELPEDLKD